MHIFLTVLAHFLFFGLFKSKSHSFTEKNYNIIEDLLKTLYCRNYFNQNDKSRLINIFRDMKNTEKCELFVEKAIKAYTGESIFCYLFNRMMRNIESRIISLAYYMGPFLF